MNLAGIVALLLLSSFPQPTLAESAEASLAAPDAIIARVEIRARGRQHGELRLLRRGSSVVLQTLLVTRTLERVAARIRDKEKEAWPEGSTGYEESRQYREALADAVAQVLLQEQDDRYRRLLIELRLAPGAGVVAFATPTTRDADGRLEILSADEIRALTPSCAWLRREFERVAADRGLSISAVSPLPSC